MAWRFTFGNIELPVDFQEMPVLIGLFAISEVFIGFSPPRDIKASKKIDNLRVSGFS